MNQTGVHPSLQRHRPCFDDDWLFLVRAMDTAMDRAMDKAMNKAMDTESIVQRVNQIVAQKTGTSLKDIQIHILRGSLNQEGYVKMALQLNRNEASIKKQASFLWQLLSQVFGEKVTKTRLEALRRSVLPGAIAFGEKLQFSGHIDWADAPDVQNFLGRKKDLTTLQQWIKRDRCRLIAIVGFPGKGKTSLAVKLAEELSLEFEGIIWRSLLNAPPLEEILRDWIQFISHQQTTTLPNSLTQQISLLISYLKQNRYLLILDNCESIVAPGTSAAKYKSGYENYHQILETIAKTNHQSCLILTSRVKISHLEALSGPNQPVRFLMLDGLTVADGKKLFKQKGEFSATDTEWETLINFYQGNPLGLKLTASHIQNLFGSNVREFLEIGNFCFQDIRDLLDWHFQVSSAEENQLLFWLAIHREPVSLCQLKDNLVGGISQQQLSNRLASLQRRMLLENIENIEDSQNIANSDRQQPDKQQRFTLQPALMEYVTEKFIEIVTEEIISGEFNLFITHGLRLAKSKDYIQSSQVRVIINPLIEALLEKWQISAIDLQNYLKKLVNHSQQKYAFTPGYIGGNLIHLLCQLNTNLQGYDFSHLAIWQANLQGINLQDVNFSYCQFKNTIFTRCFGGIHSLVFSPDGEILAIGDSQGIIRLLNMQTGKIIGTFGKHKWWVFSLDFSPDGKKLVSSSLDQTVKIWDVPTGQLLHNLEGHTEWIWSVAFSPTEAIVASGCNDKTIKIWDANRGELLRTIAGHEGWVLGVTFSPDGQILASGSFDKTIKLWDLKTGELRQTIAGSDDAVWCVDFSPDGEKIASCGYEKVVRIWDIKTGKCEQILSGHEKENKVLAWSRDGKTLATGGFDAKVKFWSMPTGKCQATSQQYKTGIRTLAFSSDNRTVASGDNDQLIKIWDSQTGKCVQTLQGHTNWIWSLALSPDGEILASSHLDHKVRLWNAKTGDCLKTLSGHTAWVWSVAFSPDGKTVGSSSDDETIRLWDIETGNNTQTLTYETENYQGGIWTIAFSYDGSYLASGGQDSTVKLWNIKTAKLTGVLAGHKAWIWNLAFHPRANILASGSNDHTVKIWNIKTGECCQTLAGHENNIRTVAFSDDGRFLTSGSEDKVVKIWDLHLGDCLHSLFGHQGRILSVDWSKDGQVVGSGSDDCTIKLWQVKTGDCLHTLREHQDTVTSVTFHRHLHQVMTGSSDGTMKFWDLMTGHCLRSVTIPNIYLNMNIEQAEGLIDAEKENLKALGAIDSPGGFEQLV